MKRITLKISKAEHRELKRISWEIEKSIKDILIDAIREFTENYTKKDDFDDNFDDDDIIAISKDEAYDEDEELITVSFELPYDLHRWLKAICDKENVKIKHVVRGIINESIREHSSSMV